MKIAVFACHPDDEVISMGALLDAIRDDVQSLHLVWVTGGEASSSGSAHRRRVEAESVAAALGADSSWLSREDGTSFDDRSVDLREAIPALDSEISAIDPEIVIWPFSKHDKHNQDHAALHSAMTNILTRTPYPTRSWIAAQPVVNDDPEFEPNLFHCFDEPRMKRTIDLIKLYDSEAPRSLSGKRFADPLTLTHRRARCADEHETLTRYAEPYRLVRGESRVSGLFSLNDIRFLGPSPRSEFHSLPSGERSAIAAALEQVRVDGDAAVEPTEAPGIGYVLMPGAQGSAVVAFLWRTQRLRFDVVYIARVRGRKRMSAALSTAMQRVFDFQGGDRSDR